MFSFSSPTTSNAITATANLVNFDPSDIGSESTARMSIVKGHSVGGRRMRRSSQPPSLQQIPEFFTETYNDDDGDQSSSSDRTCSLDTPDTKQSLQRLRGQQQKSKHNNDFNGEQTNQIV